MQISISKLMLGKFESDKNLTSHVQNIKKKQKKKLLQKNNAL